MMPNKSIYRDADAAEINLYELNFARFFSIQTSENGWRRVVCELVRRAAKGTKELRLEDGTELPGEKTFPDSVNVPSRSNNITCDIVTSCSLFFYARNCSLPSQFRVKTPRRIIPAG